MPAIMLSEELQAYAESHTSPLPPLLQELVSVTQERMGERARMLSGHLQGSVLQMLVASLRAERVLEIGTFTGFSALMMAAALPADGRLTTCEIDPEPLAIANSFFSRTLDGQKIEVQQAPALETLRHLEPGFDFVFIDADKENYTLYYEEAMRLLAPGGLIAIDNALWSGRVLDPKDEDGRAIAALNERIRNDERAFSVLLPLRDGLMLVRAQS